VLINTVSYGPLSLSIFCPPLQHGKWDRAFEIEGNPNIGFDFKNSPFGEDPFDAYFGVCPAGLKYRDVLQVLFFISRWRNILRLLDSLYVTEFWRFINTPNPNVLMKHVKRWNSKSGIITAFKIVEDFPYALIYNLIMNIGFSCLVFFAFVICLIIFLTKMKEVGWLNFSTIRYTHELQVIQGL